MLDSFFQKLELNPSPIPKAQKKLKPKKFRPVPALNKLQFNAKCYVKIYLYWICMLENEVALT